MIRFLIHFPSFINIKHLTPVFKCVIWFTNVWKWKLTYTPLHISKNKIYKRHIFHCLGKPDKFCGSFVCVRNRDIDKQEDLLLGTKRFWHTKKNVAGVIIQEKRVQSDWWVLVSISPTIFEQLFRTKVKQKLFRTCSLRLNVFV